MFKRKLNALQYQNEKFDCEDQNQFRRLVSWLEDQKIRYYKIEERAELRAIDSPNWPKAFEKYLKDICCPFQTYDAEAILDWLLGCAIRLEYGDRVDELKSITGENAKKMLTSAPQVVQTNPLDSLDFESADFKNGVKTLAQLLNVTEHPDHLVTLRAISRLITERLSPEASDKLKSNPMKHEGKLVPLQETPLGFETGDYVLNNAAKILRFLYIHDMREMQTKINEAIVAVQAVTANPKTDSRLGKVGF